jgi:hypothetical protein
MFRTGNHWGRTIVWEGEGEPDENGRRPDDRLLGLVDSPELAARICGLLNVTAGEDWLPDERAAQASAAFMRGDGG